MNWYKKVQLMCSIFCFLGFLTAMSVVNFSNFQASVRKVLADYSSEETTDYQKMFADFETKLITSMEYKNHYITLQGGFARVIGERELNTVVRVGENLIYTSNVMGANAEFSDFENNIVAFHEYLQEKEIPLLYVQRPLVPISLSGDELPEYWNNQHNANYTMLVERLEEDGVTVLDIRVRMEEEGINVQDAFYQTDDHWTTETAFWASGEILDKLEDMIDVRFNDFYGSIENWESTVYKEVWLGSMGKRVGTLYGGIDDITVFTPSFETDFTSINYQNNSAKSGDFKEVFVDLSYLEVNELNDYYSKIGYFVYGQLYSYELFQNNLAYNDKKLLIIDDSYGIPLVAFMASHFMEIHEIDLRYAHDMATEDVLNIIDEVQPDCIMIMCTYDLSKINPDNIN